MPKGGIGTIMNQSLDKNLEQSKIQNILREIDFENVTSGLPTGFTKLDQTLNGLQEGNLIIVGGKSIGKTSFVLNICSNVAVKTDTCVSYFSLATKADLIANRLVAAESNVNLNHLNRNMLTENEWGKLTMGMGSLGSANLHIFDDPIVSVKDIKEKATAMQEEYPDVKHLIAVDYLSLLNPEGQQSRYEQTDFIVKKLKIMARTLNCAIILIVNLSRNYDKRIENNMRDTFPRLSDLRDSGTIEEDADVVILLHKDLRYKDEYELKLEDYSVSIIDFIVDKHRNGQTGGLQLSFIKEYSKFVNFEEGRYEES